MKRIMVLLVLGMALAMVLSAPMAEARSGHHHHHHHHHHGGGGGGSGGGPSGPNTVNCTAGSTATNPCLGTSGPDRITGTDGKDFIKALAGNDMVDGKGSEDIVSGGGGNDILMGGPGDDTIRDRAGNDTDVIYANNQANDDDNAIDEIDVADGDTNDTVYCKPGDLVTIDGDAADPTKPRDKVIGCSPTTVTIATAAQVQAATNEENQG